LCCSYFSGEQSKNCDVSIRIYLSYDRIRLSMIFGTDPTSDDACSYEERNGGRRSSRFMGSVRVHYGGGTVCVLYCPRLFIVVNAIQFRGSPILRDMWNLSMIQIPLVSFPSQIARYIDVKSCMILESLL